VTGLKENVSYRFCVLAIDPDGNRSDPPKQVFSIKTIDRTAPKVTGLKAPELVLPQGDVKAKWDAVTAPDFAAIHYTVKCGETVAQGTTKDTP
jgi:hypothetical protein